MATPAARYARIIAIRAALRAVFLQPTYDIAIDHIGRDMHACVAFKYDTVAQEIVASGSPDPIVHANEVSLPVRMSHAVAMELNVSDEELAQHILCLQDSIARARYPPAQEGVVPIPSILIQ